MSLEDLQKDVERRKARAPQEPLRVAIPDAIGDGLGLVLGKFETMRIKAAEFADSQRAEFDALPTTVSCEHHPAEFLQKDFEQTVMETRRQAYFVPIYAKCGQCAKDAAEASRRAFWRKRGVPERVVSATFCNFGESAGPDGVKQALALEKVRRLRGPA